MTRAKKISRKKMQSGFHIFTHKMTPLSVHSTLIKTTFSIALVDKPQNLILNIEKTFN
jgi:hypothetical protein